MDDKSCSDGSGEWNQLLSEINSHRETVLQQLSQLSIKCPDKTASEVSDQSGKFLKPGWSNLLVNYYTQTPISVESVFNRFARAAENRRSFSFWNADYESMRSLINGETQPIKPFSYWDEYFERKRSRMPLVGLSSIASTSTLPYSHRSYHGDIAGSSSVPRYMKNLQGKMALMAQNKGGSRALLGALERVRSEYEVDLVLDEVVGDIGMLMQSSHGSHVIEKIIHICSKHQISTILLGLVKPHQLENACLTPIGVSMVMGLMSHVDFADSTQFTLVLNLLTSNVVTLATSHGHVIIGHGLEHFPEELNEQLAIALAHNCEEVATDQHGCRVLIKFVNQAQGSLKDNLLARIIFHSVHFSQHLYGNYVVQSIFDQRMPNAIKALLEELRGSFADLSVNKYGSNVVERCLQDSDKHQVDDIIAELLAIRDLTTLCEDQFGNYVVQTALQASKGRAREALIDAIMLNKSSMRSNMYGKKVLKLLKRGGFCC